MLEITAREAESKYGINRSYVIRLHKQGIIRGRQIGPMWVLEEDDVKARSENPPKRGGYRGKKSKAEASADA